MLKNLQLKLLAVTLMLVMLPFASTYACPCDGSDDSSKTQYQGAYDGQTNMQYKTKASAAPVTTITTTTTSDTTLNTTAESDSSNDSDSDSAPYNNYPN